MARNRRKKLETDSPGTRHTVAARIGALLLDLSNAVRRAERCRRKLNDLGYSPRRWQEIVKEVNPELRFMVRPKMLDAIIACLRDAGEPVDREALVRQLNSQGAGALQRIRHSITGNLRSGDLAIYPGRKIGLPRWRKKN